MLMDTTQVLDKENKQRLAAISEAEGETASSDTHVDETKGEGTVGDITVPNPIMTARNVDVYYGEKHAIVNVGLDVGHNQVVAMIGPSGCGKSTFLRCLNRMNDTIESCRVTGTVTLDGQDIVVDAVVVWRFADGRIAEAWDIPAADAARVMSRQ